MLEVSNQNGRIRIEANLDTVKQRKIEEINKMCNQTILAGFISSALGAPHQYPFDYEDQINMLTVEREFERGTITEKNLKTIDAGPLLHTKDQFLQVSADAAVFKNQMIERYWELKNQILNATTKDEISKINW